MTFRSIVAATAILFSLSGSYAQTEWQADALAAAIAYHGANRPPQCTAQTPDAAPPDRHELQIGEETAARQALLVRFECRIGAYNRTSVFILSDQHGTVSEVVFPSPVVDVRYRPGSQDRIVEAITMTGTRQSREVVNPVYDPDSRGMIERDKWRGAGDAYSITHWSFKDGRFQITLFAVDASFDGQDNPRTLIQRDIW